jgi:hypothetical protein
MDLGFFEKWSDPGVAGSIVAGGEADGRKRLPIWTVYLV